MVLDVETWIGVDGDGVGDDEGVNSGAVSGVFENFDLSSLLLNEYSRPVL